MGSSGLFDGEDQIKSPRSIEMNPKNTGVFLPICKAHYYSCRHILLEVENVPGEKRLGGNTVSVKIDDNNNHRMIGFKF
jgi:hypothetical protein